MTWMDIVFVLLVSIVKKDFRLSDEGKVEEHKPTRMSPSLFPPPSSPTETSSTNNTAKCASHL